MGTSSGKFDFTAISLEKRKSQWIPLYYLLYTTACYLRSPSSSSRPAIEIVDSIELALRIQSISAQITRTDQTHKQVCPCHLWPRCYGKPWAMGIRTERKIIETLQGLLGRACRFNHSDNNKCEKRKLFILARLPCNCVTTTVFIAQKRGFPALGRPMPSVAGPKHTDVHGKNGVNFLFHAIIFVV